MQPSVAPSTRRERLRAFLSAGLWLVPLCFFGIFFAWPLVTMIGLGLRDEGHWQWSRVSDTLADPAIRHILWFTVWQAVASTVLTLICGLAGAYVFARMEFAGKTALRALITIPFVMPTVVVGAAFLGLLGRGGVLDDAFGVHLDNSLVAIFVAHVFFNYAIVVRIVGGLWSHLDPRQEEAAQVLGATRWRVLQKVTLPQLAPAISGAAAIVFLFTFTSFGVIQILGGPTYATLEVEIYRQTAQFLDLPVAATLSILQLAAVVSMLIVLAATSRKREHAMRLVPHVYGARKPHGWGEQLFLVVNLAFAILLLLTPLALLVERSFSSSSGYTLAFWRDLFTHDRDSTLFVPAFEAVKNSLGFAFLAMLISLFIGGLAVNAAMNTTGRLAKWFDVFLMLPLGVSAVTIGFGFLVTLDSPPLDLRSSIWLIPLAQALVAVPFVIRTLTPQLRAIDQRLREAAAVLGASPWRVWTTVDLPIMWRAGLVAAALSFAISLGEFGATIFLARPDAPTVPVAIYQLLGRPGEANYGQAMCLSVILMVLCGLAFLLFEKVRLPRTGEM